jgi:alpha-ketoglutarate-dependent taurine dioxygenase
MKALSIDGQKDFNGRDFPLVLAPEEPLGPEGAEIWMSENASWLRERLKRHGAILFRDIDVDSPEAFENLVDAAGFPRMPYIGGAAPRTKVTQGRVLTSNESPPSEPIPFHHEMAQVPEPPAYIFFYCDLAPASGGETAIVHSHRVYSRFFEASPTFANKVEKLGVRYIRVMPLEDDPTSAIGRSWKSTFMTADRKIAESKMKELGTTWQWLDDGELRTETATVPAIRVEPRTGLKTFYNSMVAAYTGWVDSRNDPLLSVLCGDGSPVDGSALLKTATAMEEECVAIPWKKGDVLFIDNSLVLHSRRPFEGGRRILATISPR